MIRWEYTLTLELFLEFLSKVKVLVISLAPLGEPQIGAHLRWMDQLLRASALFPLCAILQFNPQSDFFLNSETILTP